MAFQWKKKPKFVLHGHTYSTEEEAKSLNAPCSPEETLFSTPADLKALMKLLCDYPYPEHQIYVRKNHGFFLLSETADEAIKLFRLKLSGKPKERNGNNSSFRDKATLPQCKNDNDSTIKSKLNTEVEDLLFPRKKLKMDQNGNNGNEE